MASEEGGQSPHSYQKIGDSNPDVSVASAEHKSSQRYSSKELHLPQIFSKSNGGMTDGRLSGSWTLDDGSGAVVANLSRRVSAPELAIGNRFLHRFSHLAASNLSTDDYCDTGVRNQHKLSVSMEGDVEIDEEVKLRTELYSHKGRRFSMPLTSAPRTSRTLPGVRGADLKPKGQLFDEERQVILPDDTETFTRRVDSYKRLGKRFSLTSPCFASGRQNNTRDNGQVAATDRHQARFTARSTDTEECFSCTESAQSNLFPLDEDIDAIELRLVERYAHRGRRYSLPPANHLDSRFKTSTGNILIRDKAADIGRAPTPIAVESLNLNSLYLKQSGKNTKNISKSMESIGNVHSVPSKTIRVNKDMPDVVDIQLAVRKPRGSRNITTIQASTGVTWETKPTHKTFSFTYNDTNKVSEMLSPPVTGGIVLKSLHTDRPSETPSPEPEPPSHGLDPDYTNNNDVEHTTHIPRKKEFISPTMQIMKESWRRENNEEKTKRILRWIANEQSERSNAGGGYQNLN